MSVENSFNLKLFNFSVVSDTVDCMSLILKFVIYIFMSFFYPLLDFSDLLLVPSH